MTQWNRLSSQLRPRRTGNADAPLLLFRHLNRDMFILPLPRHRFSVGRAPGCDLQLPDSDRRLSREHFVLEHRASGLIVRDCSTNGTRCNGESLSGGTRRLRGGDRVRAGSWEMHLAPPLVTDQGEKEAPGWSDSTRRIELPGSREETGKSRFCGMLGDCEKMHSVYTMVRRLAGFDVPVLVRGESGTGKELVAQALHSCSERAQKPLVALNCAAIQSSTAASTLFGHEKGAFTGAAQRHPGVFEQASGGSLFLDEVAELSPELQASLLRVVETSTVRPLGATRVLPVSFRLIAATHRSLREEVNAGRFREDLFYRIGVTLIELPPLRERGDDIATLARHFLAQHARIDGSELDPRALFLLKQHNWPGNIRELRNTILRAVVMSDGRGIQAAHLGLPDGAAPAGCKASVAPHCQEDSRHWNQVPPPRPTPGQQRSQLLHALHSCRGNRSHAASLLGISRSTLYSRMKRLGMTGEES